MKFLEKRLPESRRNEGRVRKNSGARTVVTPDNHYAFISVEGVGTDPGTVEVVDLERPRTVATIDVPEQAAGLDFWKTEALHP
jgi:hypothetical protein